MERVTKGTFTETAVQGLPVYARKLVSDLVYGGVELPKAWLRGAEPELIALKPEAILDARQVRGLTELIGKCVDFIRLVISLVNDWLTPWRERVPHAAGDLDSVRRVRGPTRVRDALFEAWPDWPSCDTPGLQEVASAAMELARLARAQLLEAAARGPEEMKILLDGLLEPVREVALEWAGQKRLSAPDADEVVSEVIDQLYRTVKYGGPPDDLRGWTLSTARFKWRAMRAGHPAAGHQAAHRYAGPPDSGDLLADRVVDRVDTERKLRRGGEELRRLEAAYLGLHPPRRDDALVVRVAADLLLTHSADGIAEIVERTPDSVEVITAALLRRDTSHSGARQEAIVTVIREHLRRVFSEATEPTTSRVGE
jgi:DNA-directed RNA polymerase specialized sigma24 family protein